MIQDFLNELKTNGTKENTIKSYLSILTVANNFKNLPDWSKNDITKYILHLQTKKKPNKPSSIEIRKAILKKFFTWAGKKDIVEHLKVKLPKNNLERKDILTIEDIDKLIASTDSHFYKALIAFLFESGARISEATAITVKDTEETDKGILISVPQTKNGKDIRKNIYIFSQQYLRNHITYNGLSKDDRLFPLSEVAIGKMLKKIAKKAGIEKPVTPHKFRHAQATDMVLRKYQESIIRKKLGWTGDSKMIARYQHIINEDVINATIEMNGSEIQKTPLKNIKKGEPLKVTEISLQLKKLNDEMENTIKDNEEMKKENQELNTKFDLMIKLLGMKQTSVKDLEEELYYKEIYDTDPDIEITPVIGTYKEKVKYSEAQRKQEDHEFKKHLATRNKTL